MARVALAQRAVLVGLEALGAQRHRLIEPHVAADDAVSPMTTPVPWSMKKPLADLGAGMDVDAGAPMGDFRDHARQQRHASW